jgi:outer membrane protein
LDVEEDLSYAKQALIKARYDYVLNILRLKFAVGGLEEQDLASINSLLMENTL